MNATSGGGTLEDRDRRARFERYLLGTLDEDARTRVREEAIRDPDAFAELREVELDLLDAAARGALDPERRRLVQTRLASAGHNRDAWAIAQALADRQGGRDTQSPRSADAAPSDSRVTAQAPRGSAAWSAWPRWFLWPAAAAMTAILVVAAVALLPRLGPDVEDLRDPGPVAGMPQAPGTAADPSQLDPGPTAGQPGLRPSPPSSPRPPGPAVSAPSSRAPADGPDGRVLALYLPAAVLRGAPPTVRLGDAVQTVRIEFAIDTEPSAPEFVDVELVAAGVAGTSAAASAPFWSEGRVRVRDAGGQRIAAVNVPARQVPAGIVEARLSPVDAARAAHTYSFRVVRLPEVPLDPPPR